MHTFSLSVKGTIVHKCSVTVNVACKMRKIHKKNLYHVTLEF